MKKIILAILILAALGGGIYWFFTTQLKTPLSVETFPEDSGATPEAIAEITKYEYTETYTNADFGFGFKHPKDFTVTSFPNEDGSNAIIVQNIMTKVGMQVLVSAFEGADIDLTADIITADIPDMKITNAQEVLVGQNRKGIAFESDNEAFGGKSREVWFVFRGNLYQISTYAELDGFLKGIFVTWQFQ